MSSSRRLLTVLAAAVGLVAGSALSGPPSAVAVEVSQTWAVPGNATVTIDGRGFGHGTGMSQYGAEGAARQGRSTAQILAFYYPGTTLGTTSGEVTVRIEADNDGDVRVEHRGHLRLRDLRSGTVHRIDSVDGARQWRLTGAAGGRTNVHYYTDRWRYLRQLGGDGEFSANGLPVRLITPSGSKRYRGKVRAARPSSTSTRRDAVNVVSLEHYLRGVVPLEIPPTWSTSAVRSQAIAARTYAAFEKRSPRAPHYQICDTTSCQVYGGYDAEHRLTSAAIDATRNRIVTHQGQPAFTQFSSSNGGWTNAGSQPYLRARQDPYDGWSGNGVHTWSVRVTDTAIERAWPSIGDLRRITVTDRSGDGQWQGRVNKVVFSGTQGRVTVTGADVRAKLGLRSSWFSFRVSAR